jgi:ribosomal protein S18 acetylase RimI-like enzyme
MTELSDRLRSFWYQLDATEWSRRTRWGMVFSDPRFPLLYDANHAAVLEEIPGLGLEEVRADLLPALREAGAPHEQIEFWASHGSPAVGHMREVVGDTRDVVMVFAGQPADVGSGVHVAEVVEPNADFLAWYRESRSDFGERRELGPAVMEQMYRRDIEVFLPRGLRFFVGFVDGQMAGQATLLGIDGVGYLDSVVTRPEFRRRGVATATVLRAVQAGIERGDDLVHLLAVKDSGPQRLYERLGFRVEADVVSFTHPLRSMSIPRGRRTL